MCALIDSSNSCALSNPLSKKLCPIQVHERKWIKLLQAGEQDLFYNKNLQAATKTAANAPVVSCWLNPTAALPVALAEAEVLAAVAEPEAEEEAELEVSAAVLLSAAEVAARASAVALRVPHC